MDTDDDLPSKEDLKHLPVLERVALCDGKYDLMTLDREWRVLALRYGEPWLWIREGHRAVAALIQAAQGAPETRQHDPVPMLLHCPACHIRHVDEGEWARRHHHTHACQSCGAVWRPAVVNTIGVRFLPGFKNEPEAATDE